MWHVHIYIYVRVRVRVRVRVHVHVHVCIVHACLRHVARPPSDTSPTPQPPTDGRNPATLLHRQRFFVHIPHVVLVPERDVLDLLLMISQNVRFQHKIREWLGWNTIQETLGILFFLSRLSFDIDRQVPRTLGKHRKVVVGAPQNR